MIIDLLAWLTTTHLFGWWAIPAAIGWLILALHLLWGAWWIISTICHNIAKAIRHHRRKRRRARYITKEAE